ncbi:MAG: hypothetical protein OXC66_07550 [Roseovarius sp.]|nr:hypothetical protein [Roseovarius sp.]
MNGMNYGYDKSWKLIEAQLREDGVKRDDEMARRDAELARRDAELARRETAHTCWLIGVISAATAIIIAVVLSTS